MGCTDKEWNRLVPLYSKASSSDAVFFPTTPVLPSASLTQVRVNFELLNIEEEDSPAPTTVAVRRAYIMSNDGVTWSTPTAFGVAAVTAKQWHYGSFNTLSTLDAYVQIGVIVTSPDSSRQFGEIHANTTVRMG